MQPEDVRMRSLELTVGLLQEGILQLYSVEAILRFANSLALYVVHGEAVPASKPKKENS